MDLIRVAKIIREVRQRQNITVEQLAQKSNFTKGYISKLENFRVTPSLNALNKISNALGIELGDIFKSHTTSPEYLFGNIDSGEAIIRDNSDKYGLKYYALAYQKLDRIMEPFILEYHASDNKREFLMHDRDEFFILLEGEIEFFTMNEETSRTLKSGDTIYLSKNIPHTARLSKNNKYAKALIVYGSKI